MSSSEEIRIVSVGRTGAGKSAAGNTILNNPNAFESSFMPESVTIGCKKVRGVVDGRNVSVVDTPGLFDTRYGENAVIREIKQCICFAAPGPHVFLLVIRLGKFTDEEQKSVKLIQEVFGESSKKYTMILFTGGDLLNGKPVEAFLETSPKLQELIKTCDGGYHVFNNKTEDPSQVTELLGKIELMKVKVNGGHHYTTEMLKEAERAIQKEQKRIRKENEVKNYSEMQKLKKTHGLGTLNAAETELNQKQEEEARDKAETNNSFLSNRIDAIVESVKRIVEDVVAETGKAFVNKKCSIQ